MNTSTKLNKMIKVAVLVAISVVLMYFDFPIIPAFPWLMIDLSEIPALMGGFAYGPITGGVIVILKVLLRFLLKGTGTGFVGEVANIIIGLALVVPAAWIYHRNKSKKTAILGMIVGALVMQVAGVFANIYILLPLFNMHLEGAELMAYIFGGLVPFNGVKALLVSIGTYLLYKRVSVAIFKVDHNFGAKKKQTV
ncbi:ECF transporter S component [Clostridium celatum]|uniref:Riboflavin transporter n=1 Tax=Clostridium celatum DSM 1785 TaxID=545697 RepID=L1Q2J6_9CLOT|nr:ECF transporter S component [Clostridium celatum]EKY22203.1 LytS/YhcK-type transmembrane receptor domain protein [Clostridium celatum DSM 1785]MCE9654582.1 ECF transporter S component [Clostridium celatum]MDU2265174.1 ECF transporter S component [Clostridium celatum]MDU3722322.1 ECF transporter S component [Clostridium celatum]MDU6295061.1 ECF transporter S component [Clostridium celatum]